MSVLLLNSPGMYLFLPYDVVVRFFFGKMLVFSHDIPNRVVNHYTYIN